MCIRTENRMPKGVSKLSAVAFPDQVTPQALFRFASAVRGYLMRCPGLRQTTKRPSGEDDINSGHHQWLCLAHGECHIKAQDRGTIHKKVRISSTFEANHNCDNGCNKAQLWNAYMEPAVVHNGSLITPRTVKLRHHFPLHPLTFTSLFTLESN